MKRYFVKSLSVLGKNNKKYEAGQEVKPSNFEEGVIDVLVKDEHLEVVEDVEETETETETPIVEEAPIVEEKPKSTKKSTKTNTSDFVD